MACYRGVCRLIRGSGGTQEESEALVRCLSQGEGDTIADHYRLDSGSIGEGEAGTSVHVATSRKTGIAHAVKVMVKSSLQEGINVKGEIELTKSLDHPNIVKLHEIFEDQQNHYLVMELCSGGELFEHVVVVGRLAEAQAMVIMRQIFLAIAFLHDQLICHRDLKPENFIFAAKGPIESTTLKLIDFGLSRRFTLGEVLTTVVGTALYVAPEVLAQEYGPPCDLWSLGVLMYCLLSGFLPFDAPTASKVLKKVRKGRFTFESTSWTSVSASAKDLIGQLLEKDVQVRLSALQAQEHEWIRIPLPSVGDDLELDAINRTRLPSAGDDLDPGVISRLRALVEASRRARKVQRRDHQAPRPPTAST